MTGILLLYTIVTMKIFLKDIKDRFPEFEILNYDDSAYFTGFSYDTRSDITGTIYIPIVGENFDGHSFIKTALENGATCSFCENSKSNFASDCNKPIILVDSIQEGLEKVLNYATSFIDKPIIAITGSTGKTTTKRMLVHILESEKKVLWSDHSNTVWGNAALLSKYDNQDVIVLECAMDRKGEIAWHVNSVDPDIGVLLNIGFVHAEKIGSIEDIYAEKKDLADYMRRNGKPLVLNIDDEMLRRIYDVYTKDYPLITFGKDEKADFRISDVNIDKDGTHFKFTYYDDNTLNVDLKVYGEGFAYDAMAAIIVANMLGISIEKCISEISTYESSEARFEKLEYEENLVIINDAYNANPSSMTMAVETFCKLYKEDYHTIAVLGDMKELGYACPSKHKEIGDIVRKCGFDEVYYIGDYYNEFGVGEKVDSADEVAALLNSRLAELQGRKTAILLKASNALNLYKVPDYLKKLGAI